MDTNSRTTTTDTCFQKDRMEGGREGGRESEREREIEREGERDRNKKKVAFGARTHCWRWFAVLRLTQYLYIYTYFCVYVVLLSS